jgi:hypothetical protein
MLLTGVVTCAGALSGCSSGGSTPVLTIAASPTTPQTIDQGQSVNVTGTVGGDAANKGVSWSVSGASCNGNACGTLSATASASGMPITYNAPANVAANLAVTVTATAVSDPHKTAPISITVTPAPAVSTISPASGTVGTAYSATLQETGGVAPLTWSISSGTLPSGLSLNGSTGAITGTPTTPGTSNFTVKVTDSGSPPLASSKQVSITINAPVLAVTTSSLPAGDVALAYSSTLASSGGTAPVTWSVTLGALPGGLVVNAGTGQISGVPTTAGTFNFTVQASDASNPVQQVPKALSITIHAQLAVTTNSLAAGTQRAAYNAMLQSSGGTGSVMWSLFTGSLPAGLLLNANTGAITGTPSGNPGTTNFTVQAMDALGQTGTKTLGITISAAPLAITTTSLPNGTVNAAYNATLQASGGTQPYTWTVTVGALPAGLALNANTGAITGMPTAAGMSNFTVHVTDSSGPAQFANQALSITVGAAGPNNNLLNGTYAFQFTGWDTNGFVAMAGSVAANGAGGITSGVVDVTRAGVRDLNVSLTGGSFSIGTDRRGTLALNSTLGSWTFRVAVNATGTQARFIEFDNSGTRGAGVIKKQDPSKFTLASLNGDYAFGAAGYSDSGSRTAAAGAFTANGSGGINNGGSIDVSDSGSSSGQITITGGTINTPNGTTGRGTLVVNAVVPSSPGTFTFAYYIVSASKLFVVDMDAANLLVPRFSGSLLAQNKPGGGFSLASMNGAAIFTNTGFDVSHVSTNTGVGQVNANGSGTLTSVALDQNSDGMILTATSNGSYTMAPSGRGVATITGINPEVIYLVDTNKGFLLEGTQSQPGNDVGLGFFEPQTGGAFSAASLSGQYQFGSVDPATTATGVNSGVVTVSAANPPFSGTTDFSGSTPVLMPDQAFTASYQTSLGANGRAVINITPSGGTPFPVIFWVVSGSKVVGIVGDATQANTTVLIFEK